MHVALLNQVYWPHHAATSQLLTELGEGLAARGHQVTAVAATAVGPTGRPTPLAEERRGVAIRRVPATRRGKGTLLDRLTDYGTFYLGAVLRLAALRPAPDVVLALTTPPLIAVAAQASGLFRRFPTVSLVQDVYPDIAEALGVIRPGGAAARAWRAVARASLRASERVVVLSEPMRERIAALGVADGRLDVIPNWALEELDATSSGDAMRLRYGFGDRFVVMYSGNLGAGHTFDGLLAAAERLAGRADIAFAFVGDGVRRREVEAAVRARRLPNVSFFPYAAREDLADSLAAADLHVVTMREDLVGLLMPSKLYGIMAAARPALFIGPERAAVARTVSDAGCGWTRADDDVGGIVAAIEAVARSGDRGRGAGLAGRRHLDRVGARAVALDAYERVLTSALRDRGRRHGGHAMGPTGGATTRGSAARGRAGGELV